MKNISANQKTVKREIEYDRLNSHKRGAVQLAYTYLKTDLPWKTDWSQMLKYCGKKLIYAQDPDSKKWGIAAAMFCQKRLCPLCAWRRSIRTFYNVLQIISAEEFKGLEFVFMTLTIKNCSGADLPKTLDWILSAWQILTDNKRQPFRVAFEGTLRSVEITYNPRTKEYHPHIHVLVAVSKDYFKKSNQNYFSHERLREVWADALNRAVKIKRTNEGVRRLDADTFGATLNLGPKVLPISNAVMEKYPLIDYAPQVRIEKVKNATSKSIAEIAKYTVKPGDYIDLPEVVQVLDPALRQRRLIAYGGLFAEVQKRLKLEDERIAEIDFSDDKVGDILKNPLIKKIALEWTFQGVYKIIPYKELEMTDEKLLEDLKREVLALRNDCAFERSKGHGNFINPDEVIERLDEMVALFEKVKEEV